jgi:hypothetical protein
MRTASCIALAVAVAGCAGDGTGTLTVSWSLADYDARVPVTCSGYQITEVTVSATRFVKLLAETTSVTVPCADGTAELPDLLLGNYVIGLEPVGAQGDRAGLFPGGDPVTLERAEEVVASEAASILVWQPTSKAYPQWQLRRGEEVIACSLVPNHGVRVTITPVGLPAIIQIADCSRAVPASEIPYGPFTIQAELLGTSDQTIATSLVTKIAAGRGVVIANAYIQLP